jgi:hypothetical protein
MNRVIAVVACGLTVTACTSWMPSFDMPSFGSGSAAEASLAVESDPPGAQASTPGGASCTTPCRLSVAPSGPFAVNIALNGYVPQSVPVRIVQPDDPRLGSYEGGSGAVRLDPNPVYVELERAPAPPPPQKKKPAKPRPASAARSAPATAAAATQVPGEPPAAPTTAAASAAAAQPGGATAPWPMPR